MLKSQAVQVLQVIVTQIERRGAGQDLSDPCRIITQFWDMEWNLLVEIDPCKDNQ